MLTHIQPKTSRVKRRSVWSSNFSQKKKYSLWLSWYRTWQQDYVTQKNARANQLLLIGLRDPESSWGIQEISSLHFRFTSFSHESNSQTWPSNDGFLFRSWRLIQDVPPHKLSKGKIPFHTTKTDGQHPTNFRAFCPSSSRQAPCPTQ